MTFEAVNHKDRIRPEGKACLLVYGYNENELAAISNYADAIGRLDCIKVHANQVGTTLKHLIEEKPRSEVLASTPKERVIILNAVSNFELNSFVQQFGSLKLPRPMFATVTPTSINWKFKRLIKDLREERAMFEKMRQEGKI